MYEQQKESSDPIDIIPVIGTDGMMTAAAGVAYAGLSVEEARAKFVTWLRDEGLLENEEEITQNVGTSDRFGDVLEEIPMTQWWLDVQKEIPGRGKGLRDLMREAVTTGLDGDKNQRVAIEPSRESKRYLDRVENLRDWCLSRQIWWGHRVPAWHCDANEHVTVSAKTPTTCVECGDTALTQDPDTLDTWFSSSTWTFSTLGWPCSAPTGASQGKPDSCPDLKEYHPTEWMQMGYEILYLWLMRMILMSTYALKEIPFKNAYIHGMLRDKHGAKFSKSANNGVDPLDIIAQYGTDALRYSLMAGVTPGNDSRFSEEKVEGAQHLVNKLWNIGRFVLSFESGGARADMSLADQWILARFAAVTQSVTHDLETYRFSQASETLRAFTWNDFADWYVEVKKIEGDAHGLLRKIFMDLLKLWHPFTPFVTEVLWKHFAGDGFIMVADWPEETHTNAAAKNAFIHLQEVITAIRHARSTVGIKPSQKLGAIIASTTHEKILSGSHDVLLQLARLENITFTKTVHATEETIALTVGDTVILLSVGAILDLKKERARIAHEAEKQTAYIKKLEAKLENSAFTDNAAADVVDTARDRLANAKTELTRLKQFLTE
jgi:valyl-tRNA synthetase